MLNVSALYGHDYNTIVDEWLVPLALARRTQVQLPFQTKALYALPAYCMKWVSQYKDSYYMCQLLF